MTAVDRKVAQHTTRARISHAHLADNVVCVHTTTGHAFQIPAQTSPLFAPGEEVLVTVSTVKED